MSMDHKFKRFGKYLILDHLVDGGMAKICRARYLGEQGNKVVAIKMVQPQFSKDQAFVQMFGDELKVTFGLVHPNIAQVFDYGLVNEQLYSAMEYVDGANLKQFLDRLKEKNFVFPVEISTYIISQVCQALHYAHTFTDKLSGQPFNIIHRDISPHNIMLTYDGAVKVIDFGIAKADSNSEATQAGTIKGKLSYLAPEYLDGLELDHRYDQFAVGITLWEMLCSRKLFSAKNDLAVLKQIQACKIPRPSSINPNVPKELDEIVLKSLSLDRENRFENLDKLNRALVKFLYSNYPDFNATDLGYFAKQLFKEEISADKKKFVEFGKIDIKPYLSDLNHEGSPSANNSSTPSDLKTTIDLGERDLSSVPYEEKLDLDMDSLTATRTLGKTSGRRSQGKDIESGDDQKKLDVQQATSRTKVSKTSARKRSPIRETKSAPKSNKVLPLLIVASLIGFFVFKGDIFDAINDSRDVAGIKSQKKSVDKIVSDIKEVGVITFNNLDSQMQIYINGSPVEVLGIEAKVSLGKVYNIEVHKDGFKKYVLGSGITLTKDSPYKSMTIPNLERLKTGFLSTSLNYTSGSRLKFKIGNEEVEKVLPLKNERVPAGTYDAVIVNPLLGTERKVRFTVEEYKRNFLK